MGFRLSKTHAAVAAAILCLLPSGAARAEQTLDLRLEPVGAASAQPKQEPESRQTVRLPSRGALSGNRGGSLGRVGYVQASETIIRKSTSSSARSLFAVSKGTPLAVIDTAGKWYGVLMVDGSTGWVPASDLTVSDLRLVADSDDSPAGVSNLIRYAMSFMGTPYVWGGASRSGTDCSGFVQQVWGASGSKLPRTAREQALVGESVAPESLAAGDRLYFACKGGAVDHTGIFVGNGMFIHSSSSRGGVVLEQLMGSRYLKWLVGCKRG